MTGFVQHGSRTEVRSDIPVPDLVFETDLLRLQLIREKHFEVHFQSNRDVLAVPLGRISTEAAFDSDKISPHVADAGKLNFHPAGSRTYSVSVGETADIIAVDAKPSLRRDLEDEHSEGALNEVAINLEAKSSRLVIREISRFLLSEAQKTKSHADSLGILLMSIAIRQAGNLRQPKYRNAPILDPMELKSVIDTIDMTLMDNLTASDVARYSGYNEQTLKFSIRHLTGGTFSNLVEKRRVAIAMNLLQSEDSSEEVVARDTGFLSLEKFRSAFFSHVGVTPGEYRARHIC